MANFVFEQTEWANTHWKNIRARLGKWAKTPDKYRFCFFWRDQHQAHDLIICQLNEPLKALQYRLDQTIAQGAHVLLIQESHFYLITAKRFYHLRARDQSEDWLSAWLAFIDCGFELIDALVLALAWREKLLLQEDAWPIQLVDFPIVESTPIIHSAFLTCQNNLGLYPLVPDEYWLERCLRAGVRTVQLRMKGISLEKRRKIAHQAVQLSKHYPKACLFINDDWRLALDVGAYGVHLGQEDLQNPEIDFEQLAKAGLRLGISTHGYYEILLALQLRPSYIAIGPIFSTESKKVQASLQGVCRLRRYWQLLDNQIPVVAIGGINLDTVSEVLKTGVKSVAVIQSIIKSQSPEEVIEQFNRLLI